MKHYIASVRDKETKKLTLIESDYERKSDFYNDLRANGYSVRFITTEDKFDEACEKWYEACEKSKMIHKAIYDGNKRMAARLGMTMKEYTNYIKNL